MRKVEKKPVAEEAEAEKKPVAEEAEAEKKPVAEEAEVEAPLEVEAPSVELKGETAAAAFQAAFNGTGYFNTTGSEHATRVGDGLVRLELLDGDDRRTVTVRVPFAVKFLVEED